MIRHAWTAISRGASVDRESNNVSLFDVLEQIQVEMVPPPGLGADELVGIPCEFRIVSTWYREGAAPEKGRARFKILGFNKTLAEAIANIDVGEKARARIIAPVGVIPVLPKPGTHHLFVIAEFEDAKGQWEEVARVPLELSISLKAAGVAAPASPPAHL